MILKKVEQTIEEQRMLRQGDRILIAVSGGADSVCLLLCFCKLKKKYDLTLHAFHLNHGIRGEEAQRDQGFVQNLCEEVGVPLTICREDIPALAQALHLTEEEAGRKRRYELLSELAEKEKAGVVAVAHHRDDQSETLLLNLLRGSGMKGLCGMEAVRPLKPGSDIRLIRPFLALSRSEIEDWLKEEGRDYITDSSNLETAYSRNWLRLSLLPEIESRYPGFSQRLAGLAEEVKAAEAFLSAPAQAFLEEQQEAALDPKGLRELPEILRQRVFRLWLDRNGGLRDVTREHFAALEGLASDTGGSRLCLPGGRLAVREQDAIRIFCGERPEPRLPSYSARIFPCQKPVEIPQKEYTKWLDYDTIKYPAELRFRKTGDYFLLPGGKRKSLKEYMIEKRIPASERDRIPLFANGSHVLWLVGYRLSQAVYVTDKTDTVLELTIGEMQ